MNIFGINGGELIVLIVLALMLLGPEKIPQYLRTLREWIHKARVFADGAKDQFREETGTDFDDVDWKKYDPRQYDPRRVIREALAEPIDELETSLNDAKNTAQDAADTVIAKPAERPALTQAEIVAAAVPIDQLEQQSQFPDPGRPQPELDPTDQQDSTPPAASFTQVATSEVPDEAALEPTVLPTPFDAEST